MLYRLQTIHQLTDNLDSFSKTSNQTSNEWANPFQHSTPQKGIPIQRCNPRNANWTCALRKFYSLIENSMQDLINDWWFMQVRSTKLVHGRAAEQAKDSDVCAYFQGFFSMLRAPKAHKTLNKTLIFLRKTIGPCALAVFGH